MAGGLKHPSPFFPKSVKIFSLWLPLGISVSNLVGRSEKNGSRDASDTDPGLDEKSRYAP
jgi:hypothetical protein